MEDFDALEEFILSGSFIVGPKNFIIRLKRDWDPDIKPKYLKHGEIALKRSTGEFFIGDRNKGIISFRIQRV